MLWIRITAWTVGVLAVLFEGLSLYGRSRWEAATRALLGRLEGARRPVATGRLDAGELEGLPPPVQRYLRIALAEGQPLLTAVHCEHSGTFNVGEGTDQWKSFRSSQRVITQRPGFVWDATVAMAPGLPLHVTGVLPLADFGDGLPTMWQFSDHEVALAVARFFCRMARAGDSPL